MKSVCDPQLISLTCRKILYIFSLKIAVRSMRPSSTMQMLLNIINYSENVKIASVYELVAYNNKKFFFILLSTILLKMLLVSRSIWWSWLISIYTENKWFSTIFVFPVYHVTSKKEQHKIILKKFLYLHLRHLMHMARMN